MKVLTVLVMLAGLSLSSAAYAADAPRVLFLTKSSGFIHGVVNRDGAELAYAEKALTGIAEGMKAKITVTKDAGLINAGKLKGYDVVVFYTSGNLCEAGSDKQPAMAAEGVADLVAWIEGGGGFVGIHSATDTFRAPGEEVSPYTEMIGGEFRTHGEQFEGTLRVVSPGHPTVKRFPDEWRALEEWYLFYKLNQEALHVIAVLDPGAEREKQGVYNIPKAPIIWCRTLGKGRIYYNALGHRESVWDNEAVRKSLADAILWASGSGPAMAEPNFARVMSPAGPAVEESGADSENE